MDATLAEQVVAQLELDVDDVAICQACLFFVSHALERGDEREIRRATHELTPDLWVDGLELPAHLALERARERDVRGATAALADVEARGGRSVVARAIVRRLAVEPAARANDDLTRIGFQPWPPAELG